MCAVRKAPHFPLRGGQLQEAESKCNSPYYRVKQGVVLLTVRLRFTPGGTIQRLACVSTLTLLQPGSVWRHFVDA